MLGKMQTLPELLKEEERWERAEGIDNEYEWWNRGKHLYQMLLNIQPDDRETLKSCFKEEITEVIKTVPNGYVWNWSGEFRIIQRTL
jgi:hypothetical protein